MFKGLTALKVTYKGELLGTLTFNGELYTFEYSQAFNKLKLQPFPGIEPPISHSPILWAYFQSRIPNYGSPLYKRLVESYGLSEADERDLMILLATVGSRVATDPFVIETLNLDFSKVTPA